MSREIYVKTYKYDCRECTITIEKLESNYGDIFVMILYSDEFPQMKYDIECKIVSFDNIKLMEDEESLMAYFRSYVDDEDLTYSRVFEQNDYKLLSK